MNVEKMKMVRWKRYIIDFPYNHNFLWQMYFSKCYIPMQNQMLRGFFMALDKILIYVEVIRQHKYNVT